MFNYIFRNRKHPRKHPPIGCKYTKYNLVPHFIGDFFVSLYCPLKSEELFYIYHITFFHITYN